MGRERKQKGVRVEIRLRPEEKALFQTFLDDDNDESLSRWLRIAGLERARRIQDGSADGPLVPSPPPVPPPAKKPPKRRRKR